MYRNGLRISCVFAMSVWLGGFTFYGGVVVPVLHDELDSLQAGGITRRVTDGLNAIGLITLAAWWLLARVERRLGTSRSRRWFWGLLAVTSATWAGLVGLHRLMDERLDAGRLQGFYPLHRVYLTLSTLQWALNLGLLALALISWGSGPSREEAPTSARP